MSSFILNRNPQTTGEHEVHNLNANCSYLPDRANQIELGQFANCHEALAKAKQLYPSAAIDGRYYCANACHSR